MCLRAARPDDVLSPAEPPGITAGDDRGDSIMIGKSGIRKTLISAVGALVLAVTAVSVTAAPAMASSCDPYCVGVVNTDMGPASGSVSFSTAYSANTIIRIYRFGSQVTYRADLGKTTHYLYFDGLQPATDYTYTLQADDAAGSHIVSGAVSTKSVRLTVNIAKITVTNDSVSFGSGEMTAFARAGSTVKNFVYSNK